MKKIALLLLLFPLLMACEKDHFNNNNPYIPNYSFSEQINTSLPAYSQLQYPGNGIYYGGAGVRGVFVFNTGSGYTVFEATCPNQAMTSCSTMTLNGINAVCPCDNAEYSLFTGQSAGLEYPLKQYRVDINGPVLRIYN